MFAEVLGKDNSSHLDMFGEDTTTIKSLHPEVRREDYYTCGGDHAERFFSDLFLDLTSKTDEFHPNRTGTLLRLLDHDALPADRTLNPPGLEGIDSLRHRHRNVRNDSGEVNELSEQRSPPGFGERTPSNTLNTKMRKSPLVYASI